jgi:hypothetical protein
MDSLPVIRDATGRFLKGSSGNISGRPNDLKVIVELARSRCPEMIAALTAIALDKEQPVFARIQAAQRVLDRGLGKPLAAVAVDVTDTTQRTAEMATLLSVLGAMSFRKDTAIDADAKPVEVRDDTKD